MSKLASAETEASPVFRKKSLALVQRATAVLAAEKPMTLRQLFYRLVSCGALTNKQADYDRLGRIMTRLREGGDVPRTWIVDHVRQTHKPSSWSGLSDFGDTVRHAYRRDLWASMPHHLEIFAEKDALAGTVQPITEKYDVALRVCRGYCSVSFAGEIAELWAKVEKPIFAYYLGDFDPSGFDLERDLRAKLSRYSGLEDSPRAAPEMGGFWWERLAINEDDFSAHQLIALPVKATDSRARSFRATYGSRCAEVDALPPTELRRRVEQAIVSHVDRERWARLQQTERLEKQTLKALLEGFGEELPEDDDED